MNSHGGRGKSYTAGVSPEVRRQRKMMLLFSEFAIAGDDRTDFVSAMLVREVDSLAGLPDADIIRILDGLHGYELLHHLWLEQLDHSLVAQVLAIKG